MQSEWHMMREIRERAAQPQQHQEKGRPSQKLTFMAYEVVFLLTRCCNNRGWWWWWRKRTIDPNSLRAMRRQPNFLFFRGELPLKWHSAFLIGILFSHITKETLLLCVAVVAKLRMQRAIVVEQNFFAGMLLLCSSG